MEILGERPAWSLNDSEKVSRLDAVNAEINRLTTYRLHLVGDLDASGYAKDIGAGDTARFLSTRYRIDSAEARREVRLARSLAKYDAVAAALPDPAAPFPAEPISDVADDTDTEEAEGDDADHADDTGGTDEAGSDRRSGRGRLLHPAQAAVIVSVLDKVPDTVPVENLDAAERQLVNLARTFTPRQLRDAGQRIRNILDTDGPEPDEKRAYHRESLTLKPTDHGVRFGGYLANENAELFHTLIHQGAKPHKTVDGGPDPRARDKRQADALTDLLTIAAGVIHTSHPGRTGAPTSTPSPTESAGPAAPAAPAFALPTPTAGTDAPSTGTGSGTGTGTGSGSGSGSGSGESASFSNRHDDTNPGAPTRASDDTQQKDQPAGDITSVGYIPGHGPKAHLTITIDYNSLRAATSNAIGETVFGDALSAAAVRRIACDAQVIPVVLGSRSQPLDVGTTKRLVTAPMRLALNARDRGCVVCHAPPIQCEAHHLVHWINGGQTCVSNLALLCKRHHIDLHAGHWHIEIIDDVVHVTRPAWADPAPIPPDTYRPSIHHDEPTGSATAGAPWTHTTPIHRNATREAVRQAIWGDDLIPAAPIQSKSPSNAVPEPTPPQPPSNATTATEPTPTQAPSNATVPSTSPTATPPAATPTSQITINPTRSTAHRPSHPAHP